ncbi:MAG: phosphatidylglycerol lysyltransferase domain-containing protein [Lachnospiraceae bacterium]|nr:phosphatidylglycerol lysyltransferase domain-containing protein [Lachnospiraceae bacterium]
MLDFRKPTPEDQEWIEHAGFQANLRKNDAGFVNISLLMQKYDTHVLNYKGTLLRFFPEGYLKGCYAAPVGNADFREVIPLLEKDAEERGIPFRLEMLSEEDAGKLEEAFPGKYELVQKPDYSEYLHLRERLADMPGRKFSSKRNHISQFFRLHPEAAVFPITLENLQDAYKVARTWLDSQPEEKRENLEYEYRAILKAGENWEQWDLKGILVYADGKPVGMNIASRLSEGVYDIHFEKALSEYPHVWSVLERELARYLEDAVWINREEDLGDEGLRKSKLSYRPDQLLHKFYAEPAAEGICRERRSA